MLNIKTTIPAIKLGQDPTTPTYLTHKLQKLAQAYEPCFLEDLGETSLMNRTDTKFVLPLKLGIRALIEMQAHYQVLSIDGQRLQPYNTLYFDTPDYYFYHQHQRTRATRFKLRVRTYLANDLKYLGFGFWKGAGKWQARPHKDSVAKFQRKLKQLCERRWNIPLDQRITKLNQVIRGWINYFSIGSMKVAMKKTDEHLRTMIRVIIWKQWKKPSKRLWGLKKLGVPARIAERDSQWGDHYQFTATRSSLKRAVSKQVLSRKGLVSCLDYYLERHDLKFN